MNNAALNSLQEYFKDKPVLLAYLLGSQATGKVKSYSDTDIAVLFDPKLTPRQRMALRVELISCLTRLLKTDALDLIDLEDASPFFCYEAIKHRKEIFVKDEKLRIDFETKVLSRYFDRQFYLKRHSREGIQKLKEEYGIPA